jgi:glutamate formiminotransferase / 5-formyltetrahydrofolate cyclo-ligase
VENAAGRIGERADVPSEPIRDDSLAMRILQCVPNFSEGRDPRFRDELAHILDRYAVKSLDLSMDPDHNRTDCTFLGAPEPVEECAAALTARAVELIDMRRHTGNHPRMGAVDVVPFIPIRGLTDRRDLPQPGR